MADHLDSLVAVNPVMEHQADHELECCRECLLWIRFLFQDAEHHARAIAMTVAALTMYRAFFQDALCRILIFWTTRTTKWRGTPNPRL